MGQKSLVFASREPAMRTYAASCIDIACKPLVINQSWLYDRHLNTALMKERLVEVLNEYPTLAGRISGNSIICNNAGVFWEENQQPGTSVKELSKNTLPEKRFQAEFDNKAAIAGAFPLLSIKVNHLKDGTILNVKCSHFCADGGTFYRMMENWSSLARDEGFVIKPVYDDTAVSKALAATNVYGELASLIEEDMKRMLEPECESRYFAFYYTMLEKKMPYLPFDINSMWCAYPVTFIINNCLKFNIYGMDFGEGAPVFAWPLDFSDPVRFWPAPPQEDGVYIYFTGTFAK